MVATAWDRVDLIPADTRLAKIESDGSNDLIFRLAIPFEGVDLSHYAAVQIDCPPSLGRLLFAVLCAVDGVVAVTEPTVDRVDGVSQLNKINVEARPRAGN